MTSPTQSPDPTAAAQSIDALVFPPVKLHDGDEGRIPGRLGMVMYLYFREQRGLQQRLTMLKIIHEFRAQVGESNWGWWASEGAGKMYFDRKKKFDLQKSEQHLLNPNRHFAVAMSSVDEGGDSLEEVSDNAQRFFMEFSANERNMHVGSLRLYVPMTWAVAQPQDRSLVALFAKWSEELGALHGVLGIGVCLSMQNLAQIDRSYYFDLAKAARLNPGLICERPWNVAMAKGMTSVNWLTFVNDEWLDRIGGRQAVKNQFEPPVQAAERSNGLLIKAGPDPQVKSENLWHYRVVARALRPLRVEARSGEFGNLVISTPENAMDDAEYYRDAEWYLSRFD